MRAEIQYFNPTSNTKQILVPIHQTKWRKHQFYLSRSRQEIKCLNWKAKNGSLQFDDICEKKWMTCIRLICPFCCFGQTIDRPRQKKEKKWCRCFYRTRILKIWTTVHTKSFELIQIAAKLNSSHRKFWINSNCSQTEQFQTEEQSSENICFAIYSFNWPSKYFADRRVYSFCSQHTYLEFNYLLASIPTPIYKCSWPLRQHMVSHVPFTAII